jgi:hypothetical protein
MADRRFLDALRAQCEGRHRTAARPPVFGFGDETHEEACAVFFGAFGFEAGDDEDGIGLVHRDRDGGGGGETRVGGEFAFEGAYGAGTVQFGDVALRLSVRQFVRVDDPQVVGRLVVVRECRSGEHGRSGPECSGSLEELSSIPLLI